METVEAPTLTDFLISHSIDLLVQNLASAEVRDFFEGQTLETELLMNLTEKLEAVKLLLLNVEERIDMSSVYSWLSDVKDAVYVAEYLFDEIHYEAARSVSRAGSRIRSTGMMQKFVRVLCSSNKKSEKTETAEKLERITEKLEGLLLKWRESHAHHLPSTTRRRPQLESSGAPLPDDTCVYGRDDDKKAIMELLLSDDDSDVKESKVILIGGTSGIGKTTLAKVVYNDNKVKSYFDLKAWVRVSQQIDALKLMKCIIESVTSLECDSRSVNGLSSELENKLMGKKLLLVLDDVWSCDREQWDLIFGSLSYGAQGSKVIITTRNRSNIASVVQGSPFDLQGIGDDDCWLLFSEHASSQIYSVNSGEFAQQIRSEVLGRCSDAGFWRRSLPATAVSLGSLWRSIRDFEQWKKILDVWDRQITRVPLALSISYHLLPLHLKCCFAFCAIFPKSYLFTKEDLVLLWMGAGLVDSKQNGEKHFEEFASRSFFHQISTDRPPAFVMHDLANDLAWFEAGEFSVSLGDGNPSNVSTETREFSFAFTDLQDYHMDIHRPHILRTTLLLSNERTDGGFDDNRLDEVLRGQRHLRALSLSNVSQLPYSFCDLKYLWYLNLAGTSITTLPESICEFYNLQILILRGCRDLVELPRDLSNLINLHHLDIKSTSLREMPPNMHRLTKLQTLTDFFVGKMKGSSIKELGELNHLEGELRIWNLQNVGSPSNAYAASLFRKEKLKKLEFRWTDESNYFSWFIIQRLEPHENVEALGIYGYEDRWFKASSFMNIVELRLCNFRYCSSFPPLGELPSLKKLLIKAFYGVEVVGPEFYGGSSYGEITFRSLESLTFDRMLQWREWKSPDPRRTESHGAAALFPRLQVLCLRNCPRLESPLPRFPVIRKIMFRDSCHLVQLEKLPSDGHSLIIDSFHSLDSILEKMERLLGCPPNTLVKIDVTGVPFQRFPLEKFPKLKQLRIRRCLKLESLEKPTSSSTSSSSSTSQCPNLEQLILEGCPRLEIGEVIRSIPRHKLIIKDCTGSLPS